MCLRLLRRRPLRDLKINWDRLKKLIISNLEKPHVGWCRVAVMPSQLYRPSKVCHHLEFDNSNLTPWFLALIMFYRVPC